MARRVFSAPVVTTVAVLLASCTEGGSCQRLNSWVVKELVPGQSWYSMAASACRHPVFQGPSGLNLRSWGRAASKGV